MELLKKLYQIHALSGKEKQIRNFIKGYIFENIPDVEIIKDKTGNLYITKGHAETYPCIVAHLDQVQRIHSKDFRTIETEDIIFGYSPSNRRQEGLGADDKNGIWVALQCLMKYEALKIAFFVGEEVGCVGSNSADITFFNDCRFVIQPDRRGFNDLVVQISWENLCSDEFLSDICSERFGYVPTDGLMTDIEALRDNGLGISCINLSCGYYEPHTDNEFTVKKDLLNCLDFVQFVIESCTKVYLHEAEYCPYGDTLNDCGETEDMIFDIIMAHPDYTGEDAWDVYHTNFPSWERNDFIEIYENYLAAYGFCEPVPQEPERRQSKPKKKTEKKSSLGRVTGCCRDFTFFLKPKQEQKNVV